MSILILLLIHRVSTSTLYTVLVTWEQNLTVDEPTSLKVECHSEQHSMNIMNTPTHNWKDFFWGRYLMVIVSKIPNNYQEMSL